MCVVIVDQRRKRPFGVVAQFRAGGEIIEQPFGRGLLSVPDLVAGRYVPTTTVNPRIRRGFEIEYGFMSSTCVKCP